MRAVCGKHVTVTVLRDPHGQRVTALHDEYVEREREAHERERSAAEASAKESASASARISELEVELARVREVRASA